MREQGSCWIHAALGCPGPTCQLLEGMDVVQALVKKHCETRTSAAANAVAARISMYITVSLSRRLSQGLLKPGAHWLRAV